MVSKRQFYSADEATSILNVSKGTLYSYVSRGLIRSEETGGKSRARRYRAEDVNALVERKQQRRNPERVARGALHWGSPVLESALTFIDEDRLYYRGHDATELAVTRTFEEVASLLWINNFESNWPAEPHESTHALWVNAAKAIQLDSLENKVKPLELFQIALPFIGSADLTAYTLRPENILQTAQRIVYFMTRLVLRNFNSRPVATTDSAWAIGRALQQAWIPEHSEAQQLINAMLILCADHELNVSSFTVRCVASAGSSPYAAVVAGLSALQGHRHGGASELVELLLRNAESDAHVTVADRLKRGELIPGFGHPLYLSEDPRCSALLSLAEQYVQSATTEEQAALEIANAVTDIVMNHVGLFPNLDFGISALCHMLGLPQGAPLTIFAIGRTAGWIGHYLEQIETGQLIRPRATYVGKRTGSQKDD